MHSSDVFLKDIESFSCQIQWIPVIILFWLSSSLLEVYLILHCHLNFESLFTTTIPLWWFLLEADSYKKCHPPELWPWFALTSYSIFLGSHSIPKVDVPTLQSSALSSLPHPSTLISGCALGIFTHTQQDPSEATRSIFLFLVWQCFVHRKDRLNWAATGRDGFYMLVVSVSPLWGNRSEMYFLSLLRSVCHLIA